jgi:hypothetical protein
VVIAFAVHGYVPPAPVTPTLLEGVGIYTTFPHSKNNELHKHQAPSLVGEGWGEEIKIKHLHSPHPSLLPLEKEQ